MKTNLITRDFLASLKFRVMTPQDHNGFAGVDSPVPLIADTGDYLVVIDGDRCEVYGDPAGDGTVDLIDICTNIRALPMPQY